MCLLYSHGDLLRTPPLHALILTQRERRGRERGERERQTDSDRERARERERERERAKDRRESKMACVNYTIAKYISLSNCNSTDS